MDAVKDLRVVILSSLDEKNNKGKFTQCKQILDFWFVLSLPNQKQKWNMVMCLLKHYIKHEQNI